MKKKIPSDDKPKGLKIYKINDVTDNYFIKHKIFDMPFRLLICGASQRSGKTTTLVNLLVREDMYGGLFEGDDIFVISKTVHQEKMKLMTELLKIPDHNLYDDYSAEILTEIYNHIKELYHEEKAVGIPNHRLIVLDDISYTGALSSANSQKNSIINEVFCNSRHYCVSVIVLCQKLTQLSNTIRQNASAIILYDTSNKELETFCEDNDHTSDKKAFKKAYRDATKDNHSFFTVNYTKKHRYYSGLDDPVLVENDNEPVDMSVNDELPRKKSKKKKSDQSVASSN